MAYAYDAWGKQVSCTGAMASTLGVENPFRYRGYIYDEETGWYYLTARYYRPDMGRFVSADGVVGRKGSVLDHNLFAYCHNNPVTFSDPEGKSSLGMAGAMTGNPLLFLAGMALAMFVSIALPKPSTHSKPRLVVIQGGASNSNDPSPTPNPGPGPVIAEVVNTAKPEEKEQEPVLFPEDPADFHPRGLLIGTWQTPDNGLVIKWIERPKREVFEWNEDLNHSSHYHIRELGGDHYQPGTPIPEPYATIYFR